MKHLESWDNILRNLAHFLARNGEREGGGRERRRKEARDTGRYSCFKTVDSTWEIHIWKGQILLGIIHICVGGLPCVLVTLLLLKNGPLV